MTGSISTRIGVALTRLMQAAVAKKLYAVVNTASPGPIPRAIKVASSASVPDETPMACRTLKYAAIAFSSASPFGPSIKRWLASTSSISARIWSGESAILFAQIKQRHPHGAKSPLFGWTRPAASWRLGYLVQGGRFSGRTRGQSGHDMRALTEQFGCINLPPMALIRGLFWFVLFVFFTFCFVVLFEYGTHDFVNGFQKEFGESSHSSSSKLKNRRNQRSSALLDELDVDRPMSM